MSQRSNHLLWIGSALAVVVCGVHFASFPIRDTPIATETRWWLYFAMRTAHGAVPHLDLFQIKNQLASFAGALLYRSGEWAGVDPLMAIRVGWLSISALLGVLLFGVHWMLGRRRVVNGLLGVLAYCAFPLLGLLPSIGSRPKLLMSLMAAAAALLASRQWWFWAGAAGGLAFMDWQIGVMLWAAVFLTALIHGTPRLRAAVHVSAGAAAVLIPFLVYYAAAGALDEAFQQVFGGALDRGAGRFWERLGHRFESFRAGMALQLEHREWLLIFVAGGAGVALHRLYRDFWKPEARLLLPLCLYHFGMTLYLATDTQGLGDAYVLMHSFAFFLALSWVAISQAVWSRFVRDAPALRRASVTVIVLLIAATLARPGPFASFDPIARGRSLSDQRRLATRLNDRFADERIVFFANSELAFLMEYVNPLPTVSLIPAAVRHYRLPDEPSWRDTATRLVRSADPAAVVVGRRHRELVERLAPDYALEEWDSPAGPIFLLVRSE